MSKYNKYINHKTGDIIETEMSEEEALKLLPSDNNFAMDLKKKYEQVDGALTENQLFWIMKIAGDIPKVHPCDTSEMFKLLEKGKLRIKYPELKIDMTIYPSGDIWLNEKKFGAYTAVGILCPPSADPLILNNFLLTFCKLGPIECMGRIGRKTGICCFCGKELTHSISISLGRGPTCSDKYGLYYPHEEYQRSLKGS